MSVAVSGTRDRLTPAQENRIRAELAVYSDLILHVGDCPTGVDAFVRGYWTGGLSVFDADWRAGAIAVPTRNRRMLRGCSVLVAFPGPMSRGTLNAIDQAIAAGLIVHVYPLRDGA